MNKRRALAGTFLEYSENYHEISLKTPSYLSAYYCTSAGDGDMVTCSWAGLAHGPVFAAVTLLNLSLAPSRPAQPSLLPAHCAAADLGDLAAFCPEIEMY